MCSTESWPQPGFTLGLQILVPFVSVHWAQGQVQDTWVERGQARPAAPAAVLGAPVWPGPSHIPAETWAFPDLLGRVGGGDTP